MEQGFFRRYDITSLPDFPFVIQLGHEGQPCPFVSGSTPRSDMDGSEEQEEDEGDLPDDGEDSDSDSSLPLSPEPRVSPTTPSSSCAASPFYVNLVTLNDVHVLGMLSVQAHSLQN
jgi:hypothetical protein